MRLRLGVNVDHVATLRNARGAPYPDPVRAAQLAIAAGADVITAHLREDRRHIRDDDLARLMQAGIPLNLEMAGSDEMVAIALKHRPLACCLVPERREEVTTEGGLDVVRFDNVLAPKIRALMNAGIRVSLFIAPEDIQIEAAAYQKVPDIELHTGAYCEAVLENDGAAIARELDALRAAAKAAARLGLDVHAGHGLTYDNVGAIAAIPEVTELQIGHFLVGESVFTGLEPAIAKMRAAIDQARARAVA